MYKKITDMTDVNELAETIGLKIERTADGEIIIKGRNDVQIYRSSDESRIVGYLHAFGRYVVDDHELDDLSEIPTNRKFASAKWGVYDVMESWGNASGRSITKEEALSILEEEADGIYEAMIQAGWHHLEGEIDKMVRKQKIA